MNETFQEFVDSRGLAMRVDRETGLIRGVKILGMESRNGRTYLPDALAKAARLYEGAKVNVNHPKGNPLGPRDYQERIGVVRDVAVRAGEGLFADFHFNPKHPLAEQLAWDAEHAPENVGFSHNVQARTARQGDVVVVEEILRVQSVDLVADPATTRGLFEQTASASLVGLTSAQLKAERPDLVDQIVQEQAERVQQLQAEVDRLQLADVQRQKHDVARRLLAECHLPDPETAQGWARAVVSPRFLESLLAAPDERAMREIVEDRARLLHGVCGQSLTAAGSLRPLARDQHQVYAAAPRGAEEFVEAIT